ncbi:hypothetical protein FOL47_004409 [Perkinsus chesapeaki]|uniref:Heparan-alpha-glucosaminide N-acetyltransferase catalytic domain-containing protein n=1 Tax=Perkinsus chesapeaki TaxID=330153 RepID=A0A7J6M326_PERCH|nr:hypothetical protein FOL47_004409 [Perkinsus chesapeaki]
MAGTESPSPLNDQRGLLVEATLPSSSPRPRIVAIDVMRGGVMALMLIVDVCGKVMPSIGHAKWNGFHLADIVMPGFIFVVGASIGVASSPPSSSRVVSRFFKLFALGVLIQGRWIPQIGTLTVGLDLYTVRILGILQRIAICYVSGIGLQKLVLPVPEGNTVAIVCKRYRRVFSLGCLSVVVNWLLMLIGPQPDGCPRGSLTPECNTASYIDRLILGDEHMYNPIYDPEGILSTLPTVATVVLGMACGSLIKSQPSHHELLWLILYGALLSVAGTSLGLVVPINKALWTPSYSLITAGICIASVGLLALGVADRAMMGPLKWLGMNAILFFCLSDCSGLFSCLLGSVYWADPQTGNFLYVLSKGYTLPAVMLIYTILELALWILICRWLFNKRIFITI